MIRCARLLVKQAKRALPAAAAVQLRRWGLTVFYCFRCTQKTSKKLVKKCWQGSESVVLYLSAKRWDKRMTSEASARSLWKEPIDVQKHQLTLRCWECSKFRKVQKLRKKDLTKNHFGGKMNRSSAERLKRTGPWKLNNIERTCNGTYFRVGKTRKTIPNKVIHTGRKRLRAERNKI